MSSFIRYYTGTDVGNVDDYLGSFWKPTMKANSHFVIRCATPDCDWGFPMFSPFDEGELDQCRKAFRQHCIERHELAEDDREAGAWLDIQRWTLELIR